MTASPLAHCRSGLDGAPIGRLLLSVFTISHACTNHTPCTRSASDTPCQVMPKPGRCQQADRLVTGKPETRDPENRAASGGCRQLPRPLAEPLHLPIVGHARDCSPACPRSLPVAALAEVRPFPANGANLEEPRHDCSWTGCKDSGHSLSHSSWSAHAETHATHRRSRGGVDRRDPSPASPRRLLVARAPAIPRRPTARASSNGLEGSCASAPPRRSADLRRALSAFPQTPSR